MTEQEILAILDKYCTFPNFNKGETLHSDNFQHLIIDPLGNAVNPFNDDWTYETGASKLVIIFKHLPFVVKIPFMGQYESCETCYETVRSSRRNIPSSQRKSSDYTSRYRGTYRFFFFEESCWDDEINNWDYCALESYYYEEAKEWNLEECFAKEYYIGDIQGYPIYIQDKVVPFNEAEVLKSPKEYYDKVEDLEKEVYFPDRLDSDWMANALAYFGEATFRNLLNFIREHGINDLHNGNIGYIDGVPVLMDYSGFGY